MKFLVDAQLPPALARWLVAQGLEAAHVADFGMKEASDTLIWEMVLETSFVLITKDDDFVELSQLKPGPQIIWVRLGNCTRKDLLKKFERNLFALEEALKQGDKLVELR